MQEHDPEDDGAHRAQVVAAAKAVRAWVHQQRGRKAPPLRIHSAPEPLSFLTPEPEASEEVAPAILPEPVRPKDVPPTILPESAALRSWDEPPAASSWGRVGVVAGVIAIVAFGGWQGWRYLQQPRLSPPAAASKSTAAAPPPVVVAKPPAAAPQPQAEAAPTKAASTGQGSLSVNSNPPGAQIVLDGSDRGVTPLTITGLRPGAHALVLNGQRGSVRRSVTIASGSTVAVNESIFGGWLHVSTPLEVDISEGTVGFQLDPKNEILLNPGTHAIRFQNRALGYSEVRQVEIKPGWTTAITLKPQSTLSVTSTEPAEVFVDGARAGETPLLGLSVAIGTRDIKVHAASGAERTFSIPVTTAPAKLDVDFSKR